MKVLYTEHVKEPGGITLSTLKNQAELSVVSTCILALSPLSPVTTNRLWGGGGGVSLRWATGSDDK